MAIMKSTQDLEYLRHSSKILRACMYMLEDMLKPGITAYDLDQAAINFIRSHDAEPSFLGYNGFKYALCTSIDNEVVHGVSTKEKIIPQNGLVSLDLGVVYKGLYSDMAMTFIMGEVSEEVTRLVAKTKESMMNAAKAVKAGKRVGDIGFAAGKVAKDAGLGNVLELGGHGVGYAVHEEPFIMHSGIQGKGPRLFENQVIAIEPMLTLGKGDVDFDETNNDGWTVRTLDGSLAAHWEHTVLVTKKGYEILTELERTECEL
jgi:methionyl aminopeptidase